MAGLTRRSSERCRARRILRQQAPASVSKRGFVAFYTLLAFYFVILQKAAGRDVCVGNELQQQNRAMSLSRALAFVSKLGSWKRNVTPTCPRGALKGIGRCGVHYHVPPTQMSPRTHDRRLADLCHFSKL